MKASKAQFMAFAFLFFLFSLIFSVASISRGLYPAGPDVILLGVSVVALCQAYLVPHFQGQDERARRIKEKGMWISYFFILGYIVLFMGLFQLNLLVLDSFQTLALLAALVMMTVFISFVVYAKRL